MKVCQTISYKSLLVLRLPGGLLAIEGSLWPLSFRICVSDIPVDRMECLRWLVAELEDQVDVPFRNSLYKVEIQMELEMKYPGWGKALRDEFFPGELWEEEKKWWDCNEDNETERERKRREIIIGMKKKHEETKRKKKKVKEGGTRKRERRLDNGVCERPQGSFKSPE